MTQIQKSASPLKKTINPTMTELDTNMILGFYPPLAEKKDFLLLRHPLPPFPLRW